MRLFRACLGNDKTFFLTMAGSCWNMVKDKIIKGEHTQRLRDQDERESRSVVSDPMDCTVQGILQARILEWVFFPFSRGSSQPRDRTQVSHVAGVFFTS